MSISCGFVSFSDRQFSLGGLWHSRGSRFDPDRLHHLKNLVNSDVCEVFSLCKMAFAIGFSKLKMDFTTF